jgi:hypothetical protein
MTLTPHGSPIRGQENDETEAMRVFTQDPRTEAVLGFIRGIHSPAVMDDTPPSLNGLLRHLAEEQDHIDNMSWYIDPSSPKSLVYTLAPIEIDFSSQDNYDILMVNSWPPDPPLKCEMI